MRGAPATVKTRLTTDLLFTDQAGTRATSAMDAPRRRRSRNRTPRMADHRAARAYVRRSILAMSLGQVQFQTIQQCLQGQLEFFLATVLAEQGAQPGDAGVAGQVDLTVFIGDLGVPFGQGYFDR